MGKATHKTLHIANRSAKRLKVEFRGQELSRQANPEMPPAYLGFYIF